MLPVSQWKSTPKESNKYAHLKPYPPASTGDVLFNYGARKLPCKKHTLNPAAQEYSVILVWGLKLYVSLVQVISTQIH